MIWSVQQVVLMYGGALNATSLTNVNAGIFVGMIPSDIIHNIDFSALESPPLPVPFGYQAGGKSIICRGNQHLYIVLQGSATGAQAYSATTNVLEVPDTREALLWL